MIANFNIYNVYTMILHPILLLLILLVQVLFPALVVYELFD